MFRISECYFILVIAISLVSCSSDSENSFENKHVVTISHSFDESIGAFSPNVILGALHNPSLHDNHQVTLQTMPSPYEYRKGLYFNWQYIYPFEIDGSIGANLASILNKLKPLTKYSVSFELTILSNVPDVCPDSFGSIGSGVNFYSKVYLREPTIDVFIATMDNFSEFFAEVPVLIDSPIHDSEKILLGDLSIPILCGSYEPNNNWELKTLIAEKHGTYTTDESGQGWVYFSVDSSHESIFNAKTEFYITNLDVIFQEL